ncbi:unnamed protein product [Pedinophyceae sp. YPF-701]|nr:unnamed protein product [Pedinophyceae sp. YPF-701]
MRESSVTIEAPQRLEHGADQGPGGLTLAAASRRGNLQSADASRASLLAEQPKRAAVPLFDPARIDARTVIDGLKRDMADEQAGKSKNRATTRTGTRRVEDWEVLRFSAAALDDPMQCVCEVLGFRSEDEIAMERTVEVKQLGPEAGAEPDPDGRYQMRDREPNGGDLLKKTRRTTKFKGSLEGALSTLDDTLARLGPRSHRNTLHVAKRSSPKRAAKAVARNAANAAEARAVPPRRPSGAGSGTPQPTPRARGGKAQEPPRVKSPPRTLTESATTKSRNARSKRGEEDDVVELPALQWYWPDTRPPKVWRRRAVLRTPSQTTEHSGPPGSMGLRCNKLYLHRGGHDKQDHTLDATLNWAYRLLFRIEGLMQRYPSVLDCAEAPAIKTSLHLALMRIHEALASQDRPLARNQLQVAKARLVLAAQAMVEQAVDAAGQHHDDMETWLAMRRQVDPDTRTGVVGGGGYHLAKHAIANADGAADKFAAAIAAFTSKGDSIVHVGVSTAMGRDGEKPPPPQPGVPSSPSFRLGRKKPDAKAVVPAASHGPPAMADSRAKLFWSMGGKWRKHLNTPAQLPDEDDEARAAEPVRPPSASAMAPKRWSNLWQAGARVGASRARTPAVDPTSRLLPREMLMSLATRQTHVIDSDVVGCILDNKDLHAKQHGLDTKQPLLPGVPEALSECGSP